MGPVEVVGGMCGVGGMAGCDLAIAAAFMLSRSRNSQRIVTSWVRECALVLVCGTNMWLAVTPGVRPGKSYGCHRRICHNQVLRQQIRGGRGSSLIPTAVFFITESNMCVSGSAACKAC